MHCSDVLPEEAEREHVQDDPVVQQSNLLGSEKCRLGTKDGPESWVYAQVVLVVSLHISSQNQSSFINVNTHRRDISRRRAAWVERLLPFGLVQGF